MRKLQLLFLLASLIFATGCPKYRPKVNFNSNGFVKQVNDFFTVKQREYMSVLGTDPTKAKQIRNEVIESALPYIDEAYMDFITGLQSGRDRDNFVADLVELGASAAIGITNGERPLQILGVALTAVRGGRRSADLNFYKEQSTPVLITKMDGNRARVRATILTREKEEIATYPIGAAIGDIVDYYNAGTLVRAFTELHKDTAIQTKQSEDNVLVLKGVPLSPVATPDEVITTADAQIILGNLQTALGDPAQQPAATTKLQRIVTELDKDSAAKVALSTETLTPASAGDAILKGLVKIRRDLRLANPPNIALLNKINTAIVKFGQ